MSTLWDTNFSSNEVWLHRTWKVTKDLSAIFFLGHLFINQFWWKFFFKWGISFIVTLVLFYVMERLNDCFTFISYGITSTLSYVITDNFYPFFFRYSLVYITYFDNKFTFFIMMSVPVVFTASMMFSPITRIMFFIHPSFYTIFPPLFIIIIMLVMVVVILVMLLMVTLAALGF